MERETSPERYERLKGLMGQLGGEIPATMSGFGAFHRGATSEGVLDKKTKKLIALGMAIALRCDGASHSTSTRCSTGPCEPRGDPRGHRRSRYDGRWRRVELRYRYYCRCRKAKRFERSLSI